MPCAGPAGADTDAGYKPLSPSHQPPNFVCVNQCLTVLCMLTGGGKNQNKTKAQDPLRLEKLQLIQNDDAAFGLSDWFKWWRLLCAYFDYLLYLCLWQLSPDSFIWKETSDILGGQVHIPSELPEYNSWLVLGLRNWNCLHCPFSCLEALEIWKYTGTFRTAPGFHILSGRFMSDCA